MKPKAGIVTAGALSAIISVAAQASAADDYWVVRVDTEFGVVRGITDDGRLVLNSTPALDPVEEAFFYDIYSGQAESFGHPSYDYYRSMTLFTVNDVGDVGGRGNPRGDGSKAIAYVDGTWVSPKDPSNSSEVVGVGEDGSLLGELGRDAAYVPPGDDEWIVLPSLPSDPDRYAFSTPGWIGSGDAIYGTATLKWYEWKPLQGEYVDRAVRWRKSGSEWELEQLLPAPAGFSGNDSTDAETEDTWRSHFIAGNETGEVVAWLQEQHDAPLQLAKYDQNGWSLLTPLKDTKAAAPSDLNDNGVAIGVGEAPNNSVAVVWDIRTDTAWNINRAVDPALKLIFTDGAAINDRGQVLAKAKCAGGQESWYVLSPKRLSAPNLSAHDVEACATTPSDDSLGNEGSGNEQGLPPPADTESQPPPDGGTPSSGGASATGGTQAAGGAGAPGDPDGTSGGASGTTGGDPADAGEDSEGCACRMIGGAHSAPMAWLILAVGGLPLLRRLRKL